MKTLKILSSLFLLFIIYSCGNDDDTPIVITEEQLEGTWNLTDLTLEGEGTATIGVIPVSTPITGIGKDMNAKIVLTKDPNNITPSGSLIIVAKANIPSLGPIEQNIPINLDAVVDSGTWSLDSQGKLVIKDSNGEQNLNIINFDGSLLNAQTELEFDLPYNQLIIKVKSTVNLSLKKQ